MTKSISLLKKTQIHEVLNLLFQKRGFDFNGYRISMLERRIEKRIYDTQSTTISNYINLLNEKPSELDQLVDAFTINVSRFFRNNLTFEFIRSHVLPQIITQNRIDKNHQLRAWSAGCASGEEAYSLAIILKEFALQENITDHLNIFGTDIDQNAIASAKKGAFPIEAINNVKIQHINQYFTKENNLYKLNESILKMVNFSTFNLLDPNKSVPPNSIYGNFDIILCRNVLIYIDLENQDVIFSKLYNALRPNGFLILGESETPIHQFKNKFKRLNKCCKIYQKV